MSKKGSANQKSFWQKHKHIKHWLLGLGVIALALVGMVVFWQVKASQFQKSLAGFYDTTGLPVAGQPGEIVRSEPLGVTVEGGTATRILYRSQRADGTPSFSSGMVFVPTKPAQNRPVVAWAHGTLGMGEQCAPTRIANPLTNIPWVADMLQNGWVVTATDYTGFGTPGTQGYLVGGDEANDVLNSVRAARNLPGSQAGTAFTIWGHSQGGHSSLFAANTAASYTPELQLKGAVASAPAAEISQMLSLSQNNAVDWIIGPEILTSWPAANPHLSVDGLLTPVAEQTYKKIASQCIDVAALGGLIRNNLNQTFFATNPTTQPQWQAMAQSQNAPTLPPNIPLLVNESTADTVIPPSSTAYYIQRACNAGSALSSLWIAETPHMQIPQIISPAVIAWLNDRFADRPSPNTCSQLQPVQPEA